MLSSRARTSVRVEGPAVRTLAALGMMTPGSNARPTSSLRAGLANLLLQPLVAITHALVFVGIGRTQRPHFSGNEPYLLTVNPADRQVRQLGIDSYFDAGRQRVFNQVRITQGEHHRVLALQFGAITDADDIQFLGPPLGDAFHRVVDQGADQSVHRGFGVVVAHNHELAIVGLQFHARRHVRGDFALGTFDPNRVALDGVGHALGQRDRLLSNSRHSSLSVTQISVCHPERAKRVEGPAFRTLGGAHRASKSRRGPRRRRLLYAPAAPSSRLWAWSGC